MATGCARKAIVSSCYTGRYLWPFVVLLLSAFPVAAQESVPLAIDKDANVALLKQDASTIPVSLKSPRFQFEGADAAGGTVPVAIGGSAASPEVSFAPVELGSGARLDVTLFLAWSPTEKVLRKWARFRVTGSGPKLLTEVVLEDFDAGDRPAAIKAGDAQSQPILLDGAFMGVEFPISATRVEGKHAIVAYRPGLTVQPGVQYETRKAVYGLSPAGEERQAFQRYIAFNRPSKNRMHVNYNSWWTSPVPYTEADILKIMGTFETNLYKLCDASFDTFCIDMGWSNKHSLWEIDPKLFPEGFTKIQQAAKQMNSGLGLWISPSSCYPDALDNNWAAEQGYESFTKPWVNGQPARFLCLGGKHYQEAFRQRLVDMATRFNVRHFKLDGYLMECPESGHGHAPGPLSSDAIAEGLIAAAKAVREAAPDVWLEPTCFGYNPSPWWLFYVDSVIGSYGDDAPYGRVPSPVYRESYTTARDYFNLQGAYWSPVPIAAQEVLGVIHQTREPFLNDAVMTVSRGHMFLPLYMNPAYMEQCSPWLDLARVLKWARGNAAILSETKALLPPSWNNDMCPVFTAEGTMPREPYGYAHFAEGRGLVALRNPWIAAQTYSLKLAGLSAASVVSVYPEARVYGRDLAADATLDVPLAPYETVVLAIGPEPAAQGVPSVEEALGHPIEATVKQQRFTKVEFEGPADPFGPDFTRLFTDSSTGVQARVDAEVLVNSAKAELLVLVEDKPLPASVSCTVTVDGKEAMLEQSGSDSGWAATGQPRPENWIFFRTSLVPTVKHSIGVDAVAGSANARISVWVWARKNGTGSRDGVLPEPGTLSRESVALLAVQDPPAEATRIERPVTRIEGVFLDAIEPQSATTGYGTVQHNRSVWEKPMTIAGQSFRRGLGTHAPSTIVYALDGQYAWFRAQVGADGATSPTVTFEVKVDGETRFESGVMRRDDPAKPVCVGLSGAKTLELIVGDGGNGLAADHANWANARLMK